MASRCRSVVHLLGGFAAHDSDLGGSIPLPHQAQRVLAVLAVTRVTSRSWIAGTLWPDTTEDRAHSSLRTAIWQIARASTDFVHSSGTQVRLAADVQVDLADLRQAADAALQDTASTEQIAMLRRAPDLLPGWYDDWLLFERESLTQVRLHALEHLGRRQLTQGRPAEALASALAAVALEPLRDSSHRLVVQAHLAQGNAAQALRHFDTYRRLLHSELGIPPSAQMKRLVMTVQPAGIGQQVVRLPPD